MPVRLLEDVRLPFTLLEDVTLPVEVVEDVTVTVALFVSDIVVDGVGVGLGELDPDPVRVPLTVGDSDGLAPSVKDDVGELVSDGV